MTTRGNPSLDPEKANTTTAGIVYAPAWLDGLRLSADWYNIEINGLIGVIQAQQVLDRCYLDNLAQFCADVATGANGAITGVTVRQQNLNYFETQGVDIEAAYCFPLSVVSENLPGRGQPAGARELRAEARHDGGDQCHHDRRCRPVHQSALDDLHHRGLRHRPPVDDAGPGAISPAVPSTTTRWWAPGRSTSTSTTWRPVSSPTFRCSTTSVISGR